jgi:hypothetical protein
MNRETTVHFNRTNVSASKHTYRNEKRSVPKLREEYQQESLKCRLIGHRDQLSSNGKQHKKVSGGIEKERERNGTGKE